MNYFIYFTLMFVVLCNNEHSFLQQEIGDQHGDAGLPTEASQDTTQTQQLVIPVQEQHSHLQLAVCGAGTSGIFHHVGEEEAARPWYQCGLHQFLYQCEDDNQASGWSRSFVGSRQGARGSQMTRQEGGQVSNRLNIPVEEEGPDHGYDCGSGLQNRGTSIQQKERVIEHYCGPQELQQLSSETRRRQVV